MFNNQCDIDETINDFMIYCWYQGCWPKQMLLESGPKILYVMRAINDAAIVWYETLPTKEEKEEEGAEVDAEEWAHLAESTGTTVAQIL